MNKTFITTLLILFITIGAKAQNWALINASEVFTYSLNGDTTPVTGQYSVKHTTSTTGVDTFLLNGQKDRYRTLLYPCLTDSGYYFHRTNTLQRIVIHRPDSTWCLYGITRHQLLCPHKHTGDTWLMDTAHYVFATIISERDTTIWGQADSLKTIRYTYSGLTEYVIISKSNGVVKSPAPSGYYTLCGLGRARIGHFFPNMMDFYNWHVGDVFYYYHDDPIFYPPYGRSQVYTKVRVLQRVDAIDSIRLLIRVIRGHYVDTTWMTVTAGYADKAVCFTCFWNNAYLYNKPPLPDALLTNWATDPTPWDAGGEISFPISFSSNRKRLIPASTGYEARFCNHYEANFAPTSAVFIATFELGLGVTVQDWSWGLSASCTLLAYTRNGITVGTMPSDTFMLAVETLPQSATSNLSVYPNPARDVVNIEAPDQSDIALIRISDTGGRILKTEEYLHGTGNKIHLSVADFIPGLYAVSVITANGQSYTAKLMVSAK